MQSRFNGPASGSAPFRSSSPSMADSRSVNCAVSPHSASPPPAPDASSHAPTLDAKAERALRRKQALELKGQRAREYEERWRERCAQDKNEDSWASGWKQPLVQEESYSGWDFTPSPVAAEYPSWKTKLQPEQVVRDYKGWDQHMPSSSEDTPLGGWSYPDRSDPFDDYQTEVEVLGSKVMVTVASKGATVEKWLEGRKEVVKYGLDIEWRPTFQKDDYHYAALLQLSHDGCCLLIQLKYIDTLPASLKRLLADPGIMKGGVGIVADTTKLKNDYDLECAGQMELTSLAVLKLKNPSFKKSGIAVLTEKVLGVHYKKNKRATMSNWEIRDLTHAQIQYAAADAWLSYSILMALLNYKEIPATSPTLTSETNASGNVTSGRYANGPAL